MQLNFEYLSNGVPNDASIYVYIGPPFHNVLIKKNIKQTK